MKFLNILSSSLLQANKLVPPYKSMEIEMVLFYIFQNNINIELLVHIILMLKPFSLQVGEIDAAI